MRRSKRPKAKRWAAANMRLDSLVDIVSNSIGILIILVAFISLLTLRKTTPPQAQESTGSPPIAQSRAPQSHPSFKNMVLFYLGDQKIRWIDLRPLYLEIAKGQGELAFKPFEHRQPGLRLRFFPISNHSHCLEATVVSNLGEPWRQAWKSTSVFQRVLDQRSPQEFYAFFWVEPNSFEAFHQLRNQLQEAHYEVGWQPAQPKQTLEICSNLENNIDFAPQ